MPLYDYGCDRGHVTESRQGVDVMFIPCRCGLPAQRRMSLPALRVVGAPIPESEPAYRRERDKRDLKKQGWDGDRAVEHLRHSQTETAIGKGIDLKKANDREKWSARTVY